MVIGPRRDLAGAGPMTNYAVVPDGLTAYGVEAVSANGFLFMRGFPTPAAAGAWIAEQKAADARLAVVSRPPKEPVADPAE